MTRLKEIENQKFSFLIFFLILLHFSFSILVSVNFEKSMLSNDSYRFLELAENMAEIGVFSLKDGTPETFRSPGYPLILAVPFMVDLSVFTYTLIINTFFLLLNALYAFRLTLILGFTKGVGQVASLFVLASPTLLFYQHQVLSELPFSAVLTISLYYFFRFVKERSFQYLLLSMGLLICSVYVKPIAIYLVYLFPVVAIFLIGIRRQDTISQNLQAFGPILAIGLLGWYSIHAWETRNYKVADVREFSTVKSFNLNQYITAPIIAIGEDLEWKELRRSMRDQYEAIPVDARMEFATTEFVDSVLKYPLSSLTIFSKGIFMNMFEPGSGEWLKFFGLAKGNSGIIYQFQSTPLLDFISFLISERLLFLIVSLLGTVGVFCLWGLCFYSALRSLRGHPFRWVAILLIFYFLIISASAGSLGRLRVPSLTLMYIFAAHGILLVVTENAFVQRLFGKVFVKSSVT